MNHLIPRLQVFEIDDQRWFPDFLRARVQTVLTGLWTAWLPPLQKQSPATEVAQILLKVFGERIREYTVVDFCSGAGGPTPAIEKALNQRLTQLNHDTHDENSPTGVTTAHVAATTAKRRLNEAHANTDALAPHVAGAVDFLLTDVSPHLSSWSSLSRSRPHLHYISTPVDATRAPPAHELLSLASTPSSATSSNFSVSSPRRDRSFPKLLRTFHLSFHHFPDALATDILRNTFETADAIVITELIERTLSSLVMEALMVVPVALLTPLWAWNGCRTGAECSENGRGGTRQAKSFLGVFSQIDWILVVFTYLIPIVPAVVVFDGWMSSLRARTPEEIEVLVKVARESGLGEDWNFASGRVCHTWPLGFTTYIVGRKMEEQDRR